VPGAVDNLSACALAVAMCRFLAENPPVFPLTQKSASSPRSEEVGLRGLAALRGAHLDELKRLDVRLLNTEMVAYPEISILSSEVNGTVKNSPEMVNSVAAAAQRAGVPYKVKPASIERQATRAPSAGLASRPQH